MSVKDPEMLSCPVWFGRGVATSDCCSLDDWGHWEYGLDIQTDDDRLGVVPSAFSVHTKRPVIRIPYTEHTFAGLPSSLTGAIPRVQSYGNYYEEK
jgi:hypothetical protein